MTQTTNDEPSGILLETAIHNPETYGFKWTAGEIKGDHGKKPLGSVPLIQWTDTAKARKAFGEAFLLDLVNGSQSTTVKIQNKLRPMVEDGDVKRNDMTAMKKIVVEEILTSGSSRRVRTVTVQTFTASDGKTFDTAEAAAQHNKNLETERQAETIARLIDRGLVKDMDEAKALLGL